MKHAWAASIVLLAACIDVSGLSFDLGPVEHVDVFPGQTTVRVGDSTHLSAAGYNKAGYVTHLTARRTWHVSDTALAAVRPLIEEGDSAVLVARRPGVVRVEAQIEAVTGTATVTIIPYETPPQPNVALQPTGAIGSRKVDWLESAQTRRLVSGFDGRPPAAELRRRSPHASLRGND